MTRRITVSLPDDVAQYLDSHPNSSAIVAEAIRAQMNRAETTRKMLEAVGFVFTEESRAWAKSTLRPLTAEEKTEVTRRMDLMKAGRWEEI
jgi:hypothetical protein